MTTRESKVFTDLKERVTRPEDRFERVENGLAEGWPDVNYCIYGRVGWIEIKAPNLPARPETGVLVNDHDLSVGQSNWFLAQQRSGGRAFLFVATVECLILIPGAVATDRRLINHASLATLKEIACWWEATPVRDGTRWVDLRGALRS